jgi:hypothetical protein
MSDVSHILTEPAAAAGCREIPEGLRAVLILQQVASWLAEHWAKLAFALLGSVGTVVGFLWARYAWVSRNFMNRLNFSLNLAEAGTLDFMTVDEVEVAHLFPDAYVRLRLMLLARQARQAGRAFVHFANAQDAWTMLNVVLNHLSARFGVGAFAREQGCATTFEYVFGLTCETHPELQTMKFRVMLADKELLDRVAAEDQLRFEDERHNKIRRRTLQEMHALLADPALRHNLRTIKLSFRS